MKALTPSQLSHFESLGYNCEFGFVLRDLGDVKPSLLRWAWSSPHGLVDFLEQDMRGFFAFENLAPYLENQVKDELYSLHFHSNMKCSINENGTGSRFILDQEQRYRIYRAEASIQRNLAEKFDQRLRTPGVIYIIKNSTLLTQDIADRIVGAIRRKAGANNFAFVIVEETLVPGCHGFVEKISGEIYRGILSKFSPNDQTDETDLTSWSNLMFDILNKY